MARSFIETKNFIFSESRNRKFRTLVLTTLVVNNEILIRYANLEIYLLTTLVVRNEILFLAKLEIGTLVSCLSKQG